MKIQPIIKTKFLLIAWFIIPLWTAAQSLPSKPKAAIPAPMNIKIDGKGDEWSNFQADNKANRIYYSIANDNDKLYLAVMADDVIAIDKIIVGGINFKIAANEQDLTSAMGKSVSVTFPFITNKEADNYATSWHSYIRYKRNSTPAGIDSVLSILNNKMDKLFKEIKVTGVTGLTDSVISVYNGDDLKVASHFDPKAKFVCEFAIPLKYIPFFANGKRKFYYDLRLKGKSERPINAIDAHTIYTEISMDAQFEAAASNVAGELTLVKVP